MLGAFAVAFADMLAEDAQARGFNPAEHAAIILISTVQGLSQEDLQCTPRRRRMSLCNTELATGCRACASTAVVRAAREACGCRQRLEGVVDALFCYARGRGPGSGWDAGHAGFAGGGCRGAAAGGPGSAWGKAIEVRGTYSLNVGGNAGVLSVSCTSRGNCAAGGIYGSASDDPGITQAFVVSRQRGRWGKARKVPGLAGLAAGLSQIDSVSCASPGNCAAGGYYFNNDEEAAQDAFVVSERDGKWGNAIQVASALNGAGHAEVYSVSCPSAGNCAAAGYYGGPGISDTQPFVISQRDGTWGTAVKLPGTAALNADNDARAFSISCPSAGNCAAGGYYVDAAGSWQAFVASQRDGTWRPLTEVPGTAGVNLGGDAWTNAVSCSSPGDCAAGGFYEASLYNGDTAKWQAFVVSERDGTWGKAVAVLPTASVNDNTPGAEVESVSCPSAGNCAASGAYLDRSGAVQAFVVSQRAGKWGKATEVPGTSALNRGGAAEALSLSCPSAGNCSAGGYFTGSQGHSQAFVVSQRNGTWGKAAEVPGTGKAGDDWLAEG